MALSFGYNHVPVVVEKWEQIEKGKHCDAGSANAAGLQPQVAREGGISNITRPTHLVYCSVVWCAQTPSLKAVKRLRWS